MKILQIIQKPQLRGAEIFACQLSEELVRLGHQVDVVYLFDHKSFDLDFNLRFIRLKGDRKNRFVDLAAYRRLADIINNERYDIVQANAGDTLKYAVFSRLLFHWKAKLVYRNANQISSFMTGFIKQKFNGFLIKNVHYIISVSETCKQDLISLFDGNREKTTAISIGTHNFEGITAMDASHSGPVIIHIGSFVPEKNHLFLIRAFHNFYERHPDARLWLVGGGGGRNDAQCLVDDLGLSTSVVFWGYKKEVIRLLKSADMLVLPSRTEGLPGVILEAFSCGVPVIASAVGGIPEIVITDETGICLESGTEEAYAKSMERLMDEGYRRKVTDRAKELVTSRYLMPQISAEFESCYKDILQPDQVCEFP